MENLFAQVAARKRLTDSEIEAMYALYSRYYSGCDGELFKRDLLEKDYVIVLRNLAGQLCGFTTLLLMDFESGGSRRRAIFSGDTIIQHEYWGTQALALAWCRMAGTIKSEHPELPLYWFLIVKGYRTYRYLPLFARSFYPTCRHQTPADVQGMMDYLATQRFGAAYKREPGIVRFDRSRGHLAGEWADIPRHVTKNRDVRYFLDRNPDYAQGDELVCFTELDEGNLRSFALRAFREAIAS